MVKILVFDTETNDKPPDMPGKTWAEREKFGKNMLKFSEFLKENSLWDQFIQSWPSIIQLSYIVYDTNNPKKAKIFNKYIDLPDDIEITAESIKIHHITKAKIKAASSLNKAKIYDALNEFMLDVIKADIIVAHNVQFDRKMIIAELTRLENNKKDFIPQIKAMMNDSHFDCTMEKTKSICKLKKRFDYKDIKTGKQKYFYKMKLPKLIEAYNHFFGYFPNPDAMHDAIIDAVICLRVYCISQKKIKSFDVCGTNSLITDYILRISPPGYSCCKEEDQKVIFTNKNTKNNNTNKKRKKSKNSKTKKQK
jgi:DNA polymerase III epsilon subunit-like protein